MNILYGKIDSIPSYGHGWIEEDETGKLVKFFFEDCRSQENEGGNTVFKEKRFGRDFLIKEGVPVVFTLRSGKRRIASRVGSRKVYDALQVQLGNKDQKELSETR